MIVYSVTVNIQSESEAEWLRWMKEAHIPEVVQTGCFTECRMFKLRDAEDGQPSYMMQYRGQSLADYERYRDKFSVDLQKDHTERFGERFTASRQLLEEIAEFQPR